MPERDALDWDSNRSSNSLIRKRLQTIVSNPLPLKSRRMMRQMVLLGKDEAFRERVAFLCAGGKMAQAQNSSTNLVEQLDPQALQQQYNTILHGLSRDGLLMPFTIPGLRIAALDGIELHHHLSVERHYGRTCTYCLQRIHKKGTAQEYGHCSKDSVSWVSPACLV